MDRPNMRDWRSGTDGHLLSSWPTAVRQPRHRLR